MTFILCLTHSLPFLDLIVFLLPLIVENLQPELIIHNFHQQAGWDDLFDDDAGRPRAVYNPHGLP